MSTLDGKTALVIGVGGLGGPAALTLVCGGVRRIVLVDGTSVETRDLSGHPLLGEEDVGRPRAAAAARRLSRRFPDVSVTASERELDEQSGAELLAPADVVVDASNHFPTMFLANDAAAAASKALVHGGVLQHSAHVLTVVPGETGCLRCLFEAPPPPRLGTAGAEPDVLGPFAGLVGSLLGNEALRLLEGEPGAYAGRLLVYEARSGRSRSVPVKRREGCAACRAPPGALPATAGGAT
ncbi:MAG TPA: ThiF family adenylyltransferase [Anaeromyxobacter sp.]